MYQKFTSTNPGTGENDIVFKISQEIPLVRPVKLPVTWNYMSIHFFSTNTDLFHAYMHHQTSVSFV